MLLLEHASNFDLSVTSRRCLCESFRPPFSKGGADPTRGALVASAEAKLLFAAFLFCQAREALAPPGGVKRSQFSIGPSVSKKKAGNRFKKCLRAKGNSLRLGEVHPLAQRLRGPPHLCGSSLRKRSTPTASGPPLCRAEARHSPFCGALEG